MHHFYFVFLKRHLYDYKNQCLIFHQEYEIEDTVRIINTKQAGLYIKNNIPLIRIPYYKINTLNLKDLLLGENE